MLNWAMGASNTTSGKDRRGKLPTRLWRDYGHEMHPADVPVPGNGSAPTLTPRLDHGKQLLLMGAQPCAVFVLGNSDRNKGALQGVGIGHRGGMVRG